MSPATMAALPARIPPSNLDAERAILGAVALEGRRAVETVLASALKESDFYPEGHRRIFRAMRALFDRGEPVDLVTLAEELTRANDLVVVGGHAALALLVEQASILAHLQSYVDIVIGKGKRREAIQAGAEIVTLGFDETEPLERVTSAFTTGAERLARTSMKALYDPADDWREIVEASRAARLKTGLVALDHFTGGFQLGMFTVIAGRTSHGKSAIAVDLAKRIARHGVSVDYITLEEPRRNITARLVANVSGVSYSRLKDMSLSPSEFEDAERAVEQLQGWPLDVRGLMTIRSLSADVVLNEVASSRAQVVIVDHVHQITTDHDNRSYGLEDVAKRLQMLAIRDNKLVIALAQLNREVDKQQRPPVVADIADSSAIEKNARLILLLYWPAKHSQDANPHDYECYVAKQSDGPTGLAKLRFEYHPGRFEDREDA